MTKKNYSRVYHDISNKYPEFMQAVETLGKTMRTAGPLDEKTSHLVQMTAAAAARSQGGVRSHGRRALEAGASREEVYHALLLLTSTIGFPQAMAAIAWCREILEGERGE